jgi:acetylglutamate kinase
MSVNIDNVKEDIKKVVEYLDEEDKTRENIIRMSRKIIRLSKEIIKNIYTGNYSKELSRQLNEIITLKDQMVNSSKRFPEISAGIINNALIEFVEAMVLYNIFINKKVPSLEILGVSYSSYVLGLADAISELNRVAQITNADTLILLSDVDGLFTKNPKIFKDAKLIKKIDNLEKEIKNINLKGITEFGKGGMNTKIEAAKICNLSGCNMIIANGLYLNPINQIEKKK